MHSNQKGLFVVSLDFELMWGVRDKRTIADYGPNIAGVRHVIPSLLRLFEAYGIRATFATVGFLFARDRKELLRFAPSILPQYSLPKYSPYEGNYLDTLGSGEQDDIYHFAPSLIEALLRAPEQEIASHTFSHYYCLEGASIASFRADMEAAKAIAATWDVALKSIVFPRNQYSDAHINVCKELGFIAYRGNQQSAAYNPRSNEDQSKAVRALRLADSYMNLTGHHSFRINTVEENNGEAILNIPASRFLRPYSSKLAALDRFRLARIRRSMSVAAEKGEAYHLWWHPHNFGANLQENLLFLEDILKHYLYLHKARGMQSKTMRQLAEETLKPHVIQ